MEFLPIVQVQRSKRGASRRGKCSLSFFFGGGAHYTPANPCRWNQALPLLCLCAHTCTHAHTCVCTHSVPDCFSHEAGFAGKQTRFCLHSLASRLTAAPRRSLFMWKTRHVMPSLQAWLWTFRELSAYFIVRGFRDQGNRLYSHCWDVNCGSATDKLCDPGQIT